MNKESEPVESKEIERLSKDEINLENLSEIAPTLVSFIEGYFNLREFYERVEPKKSLKEQAEFFRKAIHDDDASLPKSMGTIDTHVFRPYDEYRKLTPSQRLNPEVVNVLARFREEQCRFAEYLRDKFSLRPMLIKPGDEYYFKSRDFGERVESVPHINPKMDMKIAEIYEYGYVVADDNCQERYVVKPAEVVIYRYETGKEKKEGVESDAFRTNKKEKQPKGPIHSVPNQSSENINESTLTFSKITINNVHKGHPFGTKVFVNEQLQLDEPFEAWIDDPSVEQIRFPICKARFNQIERSYEIILSGVTIPQNIPDSTQELTLHLHRESGGEIEIPLKIVK